MTEKNDLPIWFDCKGCSCKFLTKIDLDKHLKIFGSNIHKIKVNSVNFELENTLGKEHSYANRWMLDIERLLIDYKERCVNRKV